MIQLTTCCALLAALASTAHAQPEPEPAPTPEPAPAPAPIPAPAPVAPPAPVEAAPPAFAPWQRDRLRVDLEITTQGRFLSREGEDLSELRLDRGELGGRVGLGDHAAAELRLEAIRSAVEGGALGVDGDSTVTRIRFAQVTGNYELGGVRLEGAIGFVPDPWLRTVEDGYTIRALSRTASERLLGWPASDLAALARATLGPARLTVSVGNGEGLRFPERNNGKTTTAIVDVAALHREAVRLVVSGMFRDGSLGVAAIRDRRAGGSLAFASPYVRGGIEVVKAWGLGDVAAAEGLALGGWAEARIVDKLHVAARGASLGITDGGRLSTVGGAIAVEPWLGAPAATEHLRGRLRVWLAVDRVTASGDAMPVPGADGGDHTLVMLIVSAVAPFSLTSE